MPAGSYELHGIRVFECPAEGAHLGSARDATELVSAAWEHKARLIVIPAERLGNDFFSLKTQVAGEIIQKFVTYRLRVAIVGDISGYVGESPALRAWVHECNSGPDLCFVADLEELARRLQAQET